MSRRAALLPPLLVATLLSCTAPGRWQRVVREGESAGLAHLPPALLPSQPGAFGPALTRVAGERHVDGRALADDAGGCANCHADIVAQWRTSAHAFASFNNPIYRTSVESFRKATSPAQSQFCGGCHDLALTIDGAMLDDVVATDKRAHAGVSCLSCHSVEHASRDGNASYHLTTDRVPLPVDGDDESLRAHKARVGLSPLRSVELCASCHRTFLGELTGHGQHMPGADDYGAWLASAYAGSELDRVDREVARAECRDCHMKREPAPQGDVAAKGGTVSSHRFLGAHTWLAAMRKDEASLELARANLRGAASINVAGVRHADGRLSAPAATASVAPGEAIDIEVVLRNERVGHRFPGGTLDMHDVWVEVVVRDARGEVVAESGVGHTRDADDPNAHRLRAVVVDDNGKPVLARRVEAFRAVAYDNTLAPRASVVIPYDLTVPAEVALPLAVTARLLHRSREPELQRHACETSRGPDGPTYDQMLVKRDRPALDPCKPQPLTVISEHTVTLAGSAPAPLTVEAGWRLVSHGMAWQEYSLSEEVDAARPSLMLVVAAFEGAPPGSPDARLCASAEHQLGRVAGRQGRIAEMEQWLDRANLRLPDHPAVAFARGRALAMVWRHAGAIPFLERAASAAVFDARGWTELAVAFGSVGREKAALEAAQRGLTLWPRSPDLLRVQALAFEGADEAGAVWRDPSRAAFAHYRLRDDAPKLRGKCSNTVPGCAIERTPGHHHHLVAPR
jgi:hypothetical protein